MGAACAGRLPPPASLVAAPPRAWTPAAAGPARPAAPPEARWGDAGGSLATDVRRLRSADFVERSRAAERLVAAGEAALPSLGAAGDAPAAGPGGMPASTTRPVLRAIVGDLPPDRVRAALQAPWPVVRREAAEEMGRRGSWGAIPALLDGLADGDAEVRAASAASLNRLTNRSFGFDARARPAARTAATRRWREWWSIEGRLRAGKRGEAGAG